MVHKLGAIGKHSSTGWTSKQFLSGVAAAMFSQFIMALGKELAFCKNSKETCLIWDSLFAKVKVFSLMLYLFFSVLAEVFYFRINIFFLTTPPPPPPGRWWYMRQKTNRKRSCEHELRTSNVTCKDAKWVAQDRREWRILVHALCLTKGPQGKRDAIFPAFFLYKQGPPLTPA